MNKFKRYLKEHDEVAPTINTELHIDDNEIQKTYWGSFFTLGILAGIAYICVRNGIRLVNSTNPFYSSVSNFIPIDNPTFLLPTDTFESKEINNMILGIFDQNKNYYNLSQI